MSLVLDEHRQYLADRPRIEAFRAALRHVVQPGDVVLDLACGTGILGFLACEAGARRVYAIDDGGIIETARAFARANGFADRVTFIRELSTRAVLPERVDVVVCDQIGHLGIEAGAFEYLNDARRRFLQPGGRVIPSLLTVSAVPIESEDLRARVGFWHSKPAGLNVAGAEEIALNTGYPGFVDPEQFLAEPAELATTALLSVDPGLLRGHATYTVGQAGKLDGLCAWFDAVLAPGVHMTNRPGDPNRIDRRQVMFPTERSIPVTPGDALTIDVAMQPPDLVNWRVGVSPADGSLERVATFSHSTFRGMLMSAEDLQRTHPDSRPALTPAGQARLSVLALCDGVRSLGRVQDEVYARHPDLFPSHADAALFVAEVVTRYCTADVPVSNREPRRS